MRLWLGLGAVALACLGCGRTAMWSAPDPSNDQAGGMSAVGGGVSVGGAPQVGGSPCFGASIQIRDVQVMDADGDGHYAPGEQIRLSAQIESTAVPYTALLSVTTDHPALTLLSDVNGEELELVPGVFRTITPSFAISEQQVPGSEYLIQLTVSSVEGSACSASATHDEVIRVSTTSADLLKCDVVRQLRLSNAHTVAQSTDGRIHPGQDFELRATLTNPGPLDANEYPGMLVESSNPGVGVKDDGGWLFALGVGRSVELSWGMQVDASVQAPAFARLSLYPAMVQQRCLDATPLEHKLLVE